MKKVQADWSIHFSDYRLYVRPLDFTEVSWWFEQPALYVFRSSFSV